MAKGTWPMLCRGRGHEAGGGRCVSTAPGQAHRGQHISPGLGIALPLVQGCWGVLGTLKPWSTASSLTGMHSEDLPHPVSTGQA